MFRGTIPTPPENPSSAVPGFDVPGFMRLIRSIPEYERNALLKTLDTQSVERKANDYWHAIKTRNENPIAIISQTTDSRSVFISALKCLQQGKISVAEVASLHIWDAALRMYCGQDQMSRICYEFILNNETIRTTLIADPVTGSGRPSNLTYIGYSVTNRMVSPGLGRDDGTCDAPIAKRFFNLTDREYAEFSAIMKDAPLTEQSGILIVIPHEGCLSTLIHKVDEVIHVGSPLTIYQIDNSNEAHPVKVILAPSFTMLQAVLDVKAKTLRNKPVTLVPTYYRLTEEDYTTLKLGRQIALGLYLPEQSSHLQYSLNNRRYVGEVDGHGMEFPYAVIRHDFYHALRELAMTENVATARWRIGAVINDRSLDTKIADGELIHSHPRCLDTTFKKRNSHAQSFGDIFNLLKLNPSQKKLVVSDMVMHRDEWSENFNITRQNIPNDFLLYHEISEKLYPPDLVSPDKCLSLASMDDQSLEEFIEKFGVDVNQVNVIHKSRAIDCAVQNGLFHHIDYLLTKGAKLFHDNNQYTNIMYWLCQFLRLQASDDPKEKMLALFEAHLTPATTVKRAHLQACRGIPPSVEDAFLCDAFGMMPIHYAIMSKKANIHWFSYVNYDIFSPIAAGLYQGTSILSQIIYCGQYHLLHNNFNSAYELLMHKIDHRHQHGLFLMNPNCENYFKQSSVLELLANREDANDTLVDLCQQCTTRERLKLRLDEVVKDDALLDRIMQSTPHLHTTLTNEKPGQ